MQPTDDAKGLVVALCADAPVSAVQRVADIADRCQTDDDYCRRVLHALAGMTAFAFARAADFTAGDLAEVAAQAFHILDSSASSES